MRLSHIEKTFSWVTFVSGVFQVFIEMAVAVSHGSLSEMGTWRLLLGAFYVGFAHPWQGVTNE